ncbi:type VII secretion-associated protein [Pseudonocardia sp. GCM10023141]|uniref:type VII secretion-associated protein n=1 Tax=Pseudonocardia sp. GCM10023141 TaxID=3252653 RepID=UPI003623CBB2
MRFTAIAVQTGATALRIAGVEQGGAPRLLAQLPGGAVHGIAALLDQLVGSPPDELLLVHPGHWSGERAVGWARGAADLAGRVRTVPAPVAAAAGVSARVVFDVGQTGAEAAVVHRGAVVALRRVPVGGARLDDAVLELLGAQEALHTEAARREVRRVREALSLQPAATARTPAGRVRVDAEQLRAALRPRLQEAVAPLQEVLAMVRGRPGPVLLIGGVARTPLLAELVDAAGAAAGAAGGAAAVVASRPDAAAVLGALALAGDVDHGECDPTGSGEPPPADSWLAPAPPRNRHPVRAAVAALAVLGLGGALVGAGSMLPVAEAAAVPSGVLVQYGYRLDLPAGWEHTGGLPERRRSLITPVAAPDGSDVIAVERTPLGYDSGAEPDRAQAELRAAFDAAVAQGSALSGYVAADRLAGRAVTTYRQQEQSNTIVDWYVVLDGDAQLSVGCRHTPSGAAVMRPACATVVGSVRRA